MQGIFRVGDKTTSGGTALSVASTLLGWKDREGP